MWNDHCRHAVLIIEEIIELLQVALPVTLLFDLFCLVIEIQSI